ncbi:hypothetical protein ACIBL3_05810 [Kribbella sp. NPDC050124]|uniref:hypothetical protein n=1 Tax=Kribbella sp. NPDC050124 TaxID=3364114 RepID=UPI0037B3BA37
MARLTDEELERLLRETFADKENLVDSLPSATKSRRPLAPILMAAAAVLVVLAGTLYGVSRDRDAGPVATSDPTGTAEAGATAGASENAQVWAAAILAGAEQYKPPQGWQSLVLLDEVVIATQAERYSAGRTFSATDKSKVVDLVGKKITVAWSSTRPSVDTCADQAIGEVMVGRVIDKGDHKEVAISIERGCGYGDYVTYRLEKQGAAWVVTGTVGPVHQKIPASCVMSGKTPASPRPTC